MHINFCRYRTSANYCRGVAWKWAWSACRWAVRDPTGRELRSRTSGRIFGRSGPANSRTRRIRRSRNRPEAARSAATASPSSRRRRRTCCAWPGFLVTCRTTSSSGSCRTMATSDTTFCSAVTRQVAWIGGKFRDWRGTFTKTRIAGFGVDEFWMFLYRSIALWMFFLKSFGCNLIGWSVEAVEIIQMSAKLRDRVQGYFAN